MQVFTGLNNQVQMKCTNCLIELNSQADHKQHYKSQFHRYNIKRKILGLKPATEDQFNSKKGQTNPEQSIMQTDGKGFMCKPCRKSFTNEGVYKQHLQSKKHQEQSSKQNIINQRQAKKHQRREIIAELCLFCDIKSSDRKANQAHMQKEHGFFIAQKEFCVDVDGLIKYLHEKVDVGLLCIYCDNKGYKEFQNGAAIRSHMKDKSHCFMNTDQGFEEYEKYYDFGKLFDQKVQEQKNYKFLPGLESDIVQVEVASKKTKQNKQIEVSKKIDEDKKANNQQQNNDDEDWEDQEDQEENDDQEWSDASDEEEDGNQIKLVKQQKPKIKTKKYTMYKPTVMESGELLLPSGKLLGTRKYRHLYKQYYRPGMIAQNRKMLTGTMFSNELALKSQKLQFFRQQQKQIRGNKLFQKNRDLKLKLKMNKLQYHFRCQTPL